ncbi:MAG: hypothetical protein HQ538_04030 [Parcubacteria group bacterium]|nr:hypothetical protein [Parcubacteria group bacterium]
MKNWKKFILGFGVFCGVFMIFGLVFASEDNSLQPAETVLHRDNVLIPESYTITAEGPGYFSGGLHIKSVTYFNGSIINSSVTDEVNNPVTIADHLRVDDTIYRLEPGGDNPLKVSDTIIPTESNAYDLGDAEWKFRNAYFRGTVNTDYLNIEQNVNIGNSVTVEDITTTGQIFIRTYDDRSPNIIRTENSGLLTINNDGVPGHVGINHSGSIFADGNVNVGNTLKIEDTLEFYPDSEVEGDIRQGREDNGAAKALVKVASDGSCSTAWAFNGSVTCEKNSTGTYRITFPFIVSDRFVQVTAESNNHIASFADYGIDTMINVYTRDTGQVTLHDSASVIIVY